jgi:integrase
MRGRIKFYLYKKCNKSGAVWYARFWNSETCGYDITRSTGVEVRGKNDSAGKAYKAAEALLATVREKPRTKAQRPFLQYVADFWKADSPYSRERALVQKKPLSALYMANNRDDVRRHMEGFPPFQGLELDGLTAGHVKDWQTWAAEKGLSGSRINAVTKAMRVAVRYAIDRGELDRDPFATVKKAPEPRREKGVLTPAEEKRLVLTGTKDPRDRAAVLLGAMCGLRLGEIRGLQWGDVDMEKNELRVTHNWQNLEGVKGCKVESSRVLPLPVQVKNALEAVRLVHTDPKYGAFVFEGEGDRARPMCKEFFMHALQRYLGAIGIGEEAQYERRLSMHSLRHSFVTLGRLAGLTDFEIQALAGHKSGAMMERYSHAAQVIDLDSARAKLEAAAV